ncbi:MAG: hypothetical protein M1819_001559 [Sarea resinae]|nr:MAG: hypothetical protein M1819_001559 [Sarea resinae]
MDFYKKAAKKLPEAAALPSQYLGMYGDFITKNASAVSQIESALRSLTYIIPGRFRESEIASESLHSGVQVLSLYHDSLLYRAADRLPANQKPHPSTHARYTRFWTENSPSYKRIALTLQMIRYTELLWEMAAKRRGEKARWRAIVILEAIKAICRLLLLRLTNSRPLLSPPLPEREVDPKALEESASETENPFKADSLMTDDPPSPPSATSSAADDLNWTMPRTGLSLPSLPNPSEISNYLLSKVLTPDDIKTPKALLHRVTGPGQLAEILHILRPVLYALALQRWTTINTTTTTTDAGGHRTSSKASWRPWLLGLTIEYGARQLAKRDFSERIAGGLRGLTGLERDELRKRGWALAWWGMRGAFYENVTRPYISTVAAKLRGKLVLDILGGVLEDYEYLWDEYYFSTATL